MKYRTKNIEIELHKDPEDRVYLGIDGFGFGMDISLFNRLFEPVEEKPKNKKKEKEVPKAIPLPDWVEVGAYAYFDGKYHKITEVAKEGYSTPHIYFDSGEHISFGSLAWYKVAEARVRPWTNEVLSMQVGRVFANPLNDAKALAIGSQDDVLIFYGNSGFTAKQLLEKYTFVDGSPCGCFEHLEYDPIDECYDWVM